MAFRLQSAIAGGAKRLSEKMKAFDENYYETIKNTTSDLAKEAGQIRKDRMKAVINYSEKAGILQSDYGLTDGQVQELLRGGLGRFDQFVTAMNNAEAKAATALPPGAAGPLPAFDRAKAAQALFNIDNVNEDAILTVAEQGQAYAAKMFPSSFDLEATSQAAATGIQRGFLKVDAADIAPKLRSAIGDLADDNIRQLGSTGITIEGLGTLQVSELTALKQQIAQLESTLAGKKQTEAQTRLVEENILTTQSARKIAEAAEKRTAELFPVVKRNEQLKAREIATGITSNRLSADKLREEIAILQETGMDAAELAIELTRAQILSEGNFDSVEELFAGTVSLRDKAAAKLAALKADPDKAGSTELAQAEALVSMYDAAVVRNAELYGNNISDDILSKVNLDSAFKDAVKQNAGGLDIGAIYGSFEAGLDVALGEDGQLPEFFTAVDDAIAEMRQRFGGLKAGADFIAAKETSLINQINSYARKDDTKIYEVNGTKMDEQDTIHSFGNTRAENQELINTLKSLPNLEKGMVIYVKSNSEPPFITTTAGTQIPNPKHLPGRFYVYGSSNEWL
tara:strand:- start:1067 stop:2773 length:1707 start_codon:yes stop_codon:yes gene_type:complete